MRHGNGMQPTARAAQLAPGIQEALRALSATLEDVGSFDPSTSHQLFTFAATDFTAFALLPSLIAAMERCAPHVCVRVVYSTHRESIDELASGRVQFVLGFSDEGEGVQAGLESLDCFADDYVVGFRQGHPRIGKRLSLKQYLAERHVVVTPWNTEGSVIDAALLRLGLERDVSVQLPSVMAAPFIVANSNHLITLPRRVVQQLAAAIPLAFRPVPFDVPRYVLKAYFHRRHSASPAQRWMRQQMLLALRVVSDENGARQS
ncbi:LysR family transcriptional regulator [Caballeronia hypogeia]|uniref:LysR family transcriptional regulator n=1 Tax=Caballeronia hypogeia TaxID=1777140 RepID=A0A158CFP5_9BURK|nr:LysR family transcriptional regulator [Caballeronia hypogeia]